VRILQLTPGTGGTFYCENCLRDGVMVRGLRKRGCDVTVVPLYLPVLIDSEGLSNHAPVFFGGINVYLQQTLSLFQKTPRWLDRVFDSPWMLRRAAAREGATHASELGAMTYSMLQGRDGRQRKELVRLLDWLKDQERPDILHVSDALLLGIAAEIRAALGTPIVCSLQDEDTWVDALGAEWRDRCWNLIGDLARDADGLVAVSNWYANQMAARLRIPRKRINVVPLGIEVEELEPASAEKRAPVIGYLSRIHPDQGFGVLVDAFIRLKADPRLKDLRLRATGGVTPGDIDFVRETRQRLEKAGCNDDVEILEDFGRASRREFLKSLSVLSVPAPQGEAFGLFILEAGGCGVPVVQPDAGAFREVVELTGGGIVYDPSNPHALTESLRQILLEPRLARTLGRAAHKVVRERFTGEVMAERMHAVYESVLS
jgi:glycosyltransferase involved in cell wall biosynthesis